MVLRYLLTRRYVYTTVALRSFQRNEPILSFLNATPLGKPRSFCTSKKDGKNSVGGSKPLSQISSKTGQNQKKIDYSKKLSDFVSATGNFTKQVLMTTYDFFRHPTEIPSKIKLFAQVVKHEIQHYWVGTKLLWVEVKTAVAIMRRVFEGHLLTRRERLQLIRTTTDLLRLVPFSIFIIVPFMELLLPVAIKLFPNMLPSTFEVLTLL
jgi:hypothetical protein